MKSQKPDVSQDLQVSVQLAQELFQKSIREIASAASSSNGDGDLFFPQGIRLIDVQLKVKELIEIRVTISGNPTPDSLSIAERPGEELSGDSRLLAIGKASIDIAAPLKAKVPALKKIIEDILYDFNSSTDPADVRRRIWGQQFFTYLCHQETDLAKRVQSGNGPARGLMQFEATTVWDTVDKFIFGPTPGLISRLAAAAGMKEPDMKGLLKKFKDGGDPNNKWTDFPQLEALVRDVDSFGLCLARIHFLRFKANWPPASDSNLKDDPANDSFKEEHAAVWADEWKKKWPTPQERRKAMDKFITKAKLFDQAVLPQLV